MIVLIDKLFGLLPIERHPGGKFPMALLSYLPDQLRTIGGNLKKRLLRIFPIKSKKPFGHCRIGSPLGLLKIYPFFGEKNRGGFVGSILLRLIVRPNRGIGPLPYLFARKRIALKMARGRMLLAASHNGNRHILSLDDSRYVSIRHMAPVEFKKRPYFPIPVLPVNVIRSGIAPPMIVRSIKLVADRIERGDDDLSPRCPPLPSGKKSRAAERLIIYLLLFAPARGVHAPRIPSRSLDFPFLAFHRAWNAIRMGGIMNPHHRQGLRRYAPLQTPDPGRMGRTVPIN